MNEILKNKYPKEEFISFNEAMIKGSYSNPLFSDEFVYERSAVHGVSEAIYREKLSGFLQLLKRINEYTEIILWFGEDPFCVCNREIVMKTLNQYKYNGQIILHIVDEETGYIRDTIVDKTSFS